MMSDDLEELLEILVHSTAPTSKKEDDRIRVQALACLEFKPKKRTHITSITFSRKRVRQDEGSTSSLEELWGPQMRGDGECRSQAQEAVKRVQHIKAIQNTEPAPHISENGSRYSVESSIDQPHVLPGLLLQSINSGITHVIPIASNQSLSCSGESLQLPTLDEAEPESSYATSRFDSWESPPASIPDSQPVYDTLPAPAIPSSPPSEEESAEVVLPTVSGVSFCYTQAPPTLGSLTPLSPSLGSSLALSECSITSLHSTYLPPPHVPEHNQTSSLRDLIDEPYEIFSPVPATSSNPPLITCQLQKITEIGEGKKLMGKYQSLKKSQVRELRKFERGHWNVDTSSWKSSNNKKHFWRMLKNNIECERLGWVNAFLDDKAGNIVKVYCYGGMAEQLWCALFVMSSRNLGNATWIDAGDNKIITF